MDTENTQWTVEDATDLYRVDDWADRFFHVNDAGHAAVRTARPEGESIDIHTVAEDLRARVSRLGTRADGRPLPQIEAAHLAFAPGDAVVRRYRGAGGRGDTNRHHGR